MSMRARVLTVTTVLATVLAGLGATQIASAVAEPSGAEPTGTELVGQQTRTSAGASRRPTSC